MSLLLTSEKPKDNLYLILVREEDNSITLGLSHDGETIAKSGCIAVIAEGCFYRVVGVDKELAASAGIQLESGGQIQTKGD